VFRLGGTLLRPTLPLSATVEFAWHACDGAYVEELAAVARWVMEFVPMPAAFFRDCVRYFYQDNALYTGQLRLANTVLRLDAIRCPVLTVVGSEDPITPPSSVHAMLGAVSSRDTEALEVPGYHLAPVLARQGEAAIRCWPRVVNWLIERSA
jgi:polyhydroxyalkanoate synthase subunit PhaC